MRKIKSIEEVTSKENFMIWFIMNCFPEGIDEETDMSMYDLIEEEYSFDTEWYDNFTNFYDGVFEENDGYVDDPNAIMIELNNHNELIIEFHPGDVIFFMNDSQIGCTGPEYEIKAITYKEYKELTKDLSPEKKLFLLPMVEITENEKTEFYKLVSMVLLNNNISSDCKNQIVEIIVNNCLTMDE